MAAVDVVVELPLPNTLADRVGHDETLLSAHHGRAVLRFARSNRLEILQVLLGDCYSWSSVGGSGR